MKRSHTSTESNTPVHQSARKKKSRKNIKVPQIYSAKRDGEGESRFIRNDNDDYEVEQSILQFSRLAQSEKSGELFASAFSLSFLHDSRRNHSEATGNNEDSKNIDSNEQENEKDMQTNISYLSSFLVSGTDNKIVTKEHVASLIFPWVSHALLQKKESSSPVIWEAFTLSMEILLGYKTRNITSHLTMSDVIPNDVKQLDGTLAQILEETNEGNMGVQNSGKDTTFNDTIATFLTQSMMNKLIPCFLRAAFQSRQETQQDSRIIHMAAKCFGLIVSTDLYRPTMDYVCKDLIPLIDSIALRVELDSDNADIYPNQAAVIYLAISLLTNLRKRGRATNPKKTFQLLSSVPMLASIGSFSQVSVVGDATIDIAAMVKKVIAVSFYDSFHLDGFRSMNIEVPFLHDEIQKQHQGRELNQAKKKDVEDTTQRQKKKRDTNNKSSYQQSLFDSMTLLIENDLDYERRFECSCLFIPMLLEGYIIQSLKADNDSSKKKSRVDITAKLQFRVFSVFIYPILKRIQLLTSPAETCEGSDQSAMFESVLQCLDLLHKYDIYLPSYEDPENQHLIYLTAIGEVVLTLTESQISSGTDVSTYLVISHRLFRLNHHVYHDKISRLIKCSAAKSIHNHQTAVSLKLLCDICSTYQKLRQFEHFMEGIISYEEYGAGNCDIIGRVLIHEEAFVRSFDIAIQSSPIGQTQKVWKLVDQHVLDAKIAGKSDFVVYGVEVFLMVLKAVQVGPFSSKVIKDMCEHTMAKIVSTLLSIDTKRSDSSTSKDTFDLSCDMTVSGLILWGWLVHVHTKCCFWLNEMPHEKKTEEHGGMGGSELIPILMKTIKFTDYGPVNNERSLQALQLLSCHLIQELHSSIFQQGQVEEMNKMADISRRRSDDMIMEAKMLSKFVVQCASSDMVSWKMLCASLHNWIPYVEDVQVDSFLRWFLCIQAAGFECTSKDSASVAIPCLNIELPIRKYCEEKAAAMGLLCDASFFETPTIFQRMALVGISCAAEELYMNDNENLQFSKGLLNSLNTKISKKKRNAFHRVQEATFILEALKMAISSLDYLEDTRQIFDKVMYIHNDTVHYLCSCKISEVEHGMKLLCVCRDLAADALTKSKPTEEDDYMDGKNPMLPGILQYIFASTNDLAVLHTNDNCIHMIASGSVLCHSIVMFCINSYNDSTDHMNLLENAIQEVSDAKYELSFVIQMMAPSVQLLLNAAESRSDKSFSTVLYRAADRITAKFKDESIQKIEKILSSSAIVPDSDNLSNQFYFLSDLLTIDHLATRNKSIVRIEKSTLALDRIFERLLSILSNQDVCGRNASQSATGILYLYGSLVGKGLLQRITSLETKLKVQEITMNHYEKKQGQSNPIIDSTYAKILSDSDAEDIMILATNLLQCLSKHDGNNRLSTISAVLQCFHTMMHVVKGLKERETLSSMAKRLLPVINELVHPFSNTLQVDTSMAYEVWSIQIRTALAILLALIGKNDIITLKGYDISNILATVGAIFQQPIAGSGADTMNTSRYMCMTIDTNVYISSCTIVASLLKYYPKQLYGCVPSFTAIIRTLLDHIMTFKLENQGQSVHEDALQITKEFQKVCGLLPEHKTFFKKHIMHLVLHYIAGLEKLINPWMKSQLEPSVFFLLDCLSEFETMQMNTLMSTTSKALFQSVFKSYRKHEYKGQF